MNTLRIALVAVAFICLSSFSSSKSAHSAAQSLDENSAPIEFRIQLGAYKGEIPSDDASKLFAIDGLTSMQSKGKTVYLTAPFSSEQEASEKLPEFRQMGFKSATKVVIIEDYVLTARVYHLMYDNRKSNAADKNKLFVPEVRVLD